MKPSPEHDEVRELLPEAGMEALDPHDQERVLAHVQRCELCAAELAEYRQVTARLALLVPRRPMDPARSASLRARLLARARRDRRRGSERPALLAVRWSGWAVAIGLAGVLFMHHAVHRPLAYGWFVAGALMIILVGLGVYTAVLRARLRNIREGLAPEEQGHASGE